MCEFPLCTLYPRICGYNLHCMWVRHCLKIKRSLTILWKVGSVFYQHAYTLWMDTKGFLPSDVVRKRTFIISLFNRAKSGYIIFDGHLYLLSTVLASSSGHSQFFSVARWKMGGPGMQRHSDTVTCRWCQMTFKVTMAVNFQPKIWRAIACSFRTHL